MKGSSGDGAMSTASKADDDAVAVAKFEWDLCAGISSEESSSYPDAGHAAKLAPAGDDAELELGLSLGAKKAAAVNGPWGEYCRMLTAKDFPSMVTSRGSPVSPSSSSASSSPPRGGGREGGGRVGGVGFAGTKRPAYSVAAEVGSHSTSQVVGWPPVKAYRMNILMNHSKESSNDNNSNSGSHKKNAFPTDNFHNRVKENITVGECTKKGLLGGSLFVKVNMDGMPIGRKVNLNVHRNYETLALALVDMFQEPGSVNNPLRSAKAAKLLDGTSEFVLTYEDKDGDWMLVGTVPWGIFLSNVKRLRIMRTSGADGLAIRCRSSKVGGR